MFALSIFSTNLAFASDNVLQAIQVDGVKDSYNIILKSDDVADLRKTIQAPNKMVLDLKGIRASKTINTIYNNTSSVDSVVVEPTGENSVKILIQAANVSAAGVHFDTLKTPLGVLDKTQTKAPTDEIVLSQPMESYQPVYSDTDLEPTATFSLAGSSVVREIKNILKSEKLSWAVVLGLLSMFAISGLKAIKGKDNEIKVGLTQSLKDREIAMYRDSQEGLLDSSLNLRPTAASASANYGLKAYQNGSRSPYATSEIASRARVSASPSPIAKPSFDRSVTSQPISQNLMQKTMHNSIQKTAVNPAMDAKKMTNIDSIKFLESMTKIYEKNGRSDLAQGLKTNMKKAKVGLA